jgi:hypothetical protein
MTGVALRHKKDGALWCRAQVTLGQPLSPSSLPQKFYTLAAGVCVCVCVCVCDGNQIHFLVSRLQMKCVVISPPFTLRY